MSQHGALRTRSSSSSRRQSLLTKTIPFCIVAALSLLPAFCLGHTENENSQDVAATATAASATIPVTYDCPDAADKIVTSSFDPDFYKEFEEEAIKMTENMTEFGIQFRASTFDKWGMTYEQVKQGSYAFKSKYFPKYLKSGDSIYESAAGIGLNLYMTLEILQEFGIEDLFVYGNEYFQASTDKANLVFDHLLPAGGKKGKMCRGDSADLYYVPNNSFDLVYTGYISTLLDPLNFNLGSYDANLKKYKELCEADPSDHASKELLAQGQKNQDDWYGKWVAEMTRIAKPGAAVIIEQASVPYCDCYIDWGGVSKEFWLEAAEKNTYGWDVDPKSIEFDPNAMFEKRYHVVMVKKPEAAAAAAENEQKPEHVSQSEA